MPARILEPDSASMAADMLRSANDERLAILPSGGGTKLAWGCAGDADVVLSTKRLDSPIDHCPGDLTATVPAGAPLAAVNAQLAREGQWLPLDPPYGSQATLGGIIATNDSGPRRHRYGTPRDLIIGVEMALVDGRRAKAGGKVVKNVAGYDLSRLMCGSYGSLALITAATFKLAPLAPASRTLVATAPDIASLARLVQALTEAPLTPSACEVASPLRLLVRFETTATAADRQAGAAAALAARMGVAATMTSGDEETALWREYESSLWHEVGTLIKMAFLPTALATAMESVERACAPRSVVSRVGGRAGVGVVFARLVGADVSHASCIADVRKALGGLGGRVTLLSAPAAVRAEVDAWGEIGDALPLMKAVKARFDPRGTLVPGRVPWSPLGSDTPPTPNGDGGQTGV